jgi:NTP pyrophosphatase (non-canonical NTP hydrolase)
MIDKDKLQQLYKDCLSFWGFEKQAKMVQEECLELALEVSRVERGREEAIEHMVEEVADVYLMINQMIEYFGEERVMAYVDLKSDKVKEKLNRYRRRTKYDD